MALVYLVDLERAFRYKCGPKFMNKFVLLLIIGLMTITSMKGFLKHFLIF